MLNDETEVPMSGDQRGCLAVEALDTARLEAFTDAYNVIKLRVIWFLQKNQPQ
ncbi:MAG: hypothetical protein ACLR2G_05365 [Phascolarctobacterium faecium]